MRSQNRESGCWERIEMQSDKWTVEGAVKAGVPVSILQRSASVTGEGCVGTLLKCAEASANQGGTAGL